MQRRYEISDEQWEKIKEMFPRAKTGRPGKDSRLIFNAVLWIVCIEVPWRDLPKRFGPWKTVYSRFCKWRDEGTLFRVFEDLKKDSDYENLSIDSTTVKAHQSSAGAKRGQKVLKQDSIQGKVQVEGQPRYMLLQKVPLPILSDLLLASIGIEGEYQIVKNKDFGKRRLTWRTFSNILLFHVSDIAKTDSIIEPEQGTEKTVMLFALLEKTLLKQMLKQKKKSEQLVNVLLKNT